MNWLKRREVQLALILVVLVAIVGARAPVFLTAKSVDSLLTDSSILVMMVLAQMLFPNGQGALVEGLCFLTFVLLAIQASQAVE